MTAILEDMRRLDAALKHGDISPSAYAEAKQRLLGEVEDAEVVTVARPTAEARHAASRASEDPNKGMWSLLFMGFLAVAILTFVTAQLIGDLTIAVTLMVTVFAAILVKAAKRLET